MTERRRCAGGGSIRAAGAQFGPETLRDLPDIEALEDAGLLSKDKLLADEMPIMGSGEAESETETDDDEDWESGALLAG